MRHRFAVLLAVLVIAGSWSLLGPTPSVKAAGQADLFMSGLENPIAIAFAPDNRVFYAEWRTGRIRIIENDQLLADPFYTLENTNSPDFSERGLLGLALDPDFPTVPYVYAYHTYDDTANGTINNRIVRITAEGNVGVSHTEIFRTPPLSGATNHNGGVIGFGPDDKLYAVVGENAWPPFAQDLLNPMGKVLRMNPDGSAPPDNPFYGNDSWNQLVYTYGHRNMFGLAFHPISGGILITENGPECNDEVNLLAPGENFGWGPSFTCSTPPPPPENTNQDGPNPVPPIWWWGPTICPTNAAVYVEPYFPGWQGDLFMGDCKFGFLYRLDLAPPNYDTVQSEPETIWESPDLIFDVEVGPDGAIWITTQTAIYRFRDTTVPPVAIFTANPNPVAVGNPVQFDASASYDPDGTIVSYEWNFGDGATNISSPTPTHSYDAEGPYIVSLKVTDNESNSNVTSMEVRVDPLPQEPLRPRANFTVSPSPVSPGVPVSFDGSNSSDSDGTIDSYRWEFGDGTNRTGVGRPLLTTHVYQDAGNYTVNLTVTDNDNLTARATTFLIVGFPPTPVISVAPTTIYIGTEVRFDALDSSDPDPSGTIRNWTWDLGDQSMAWEPRVFHHYEAKGPFTVTLTIKDNDGMTNSTSVVVEVRNRPPVITSSDPEPGPVSLASGANQLFEVTASDHDGVDVLTYAWRINDTEAGENAPTLTFVPPGVGTYIVNVTVSDGTASVYREWTVTVSTAAVAGDDGAWIGLLSVAVVLIGIGSAAAVVAWRRRRGKRSQNEK